MIDPQKIEALRVCQYDLLLALEDLGVLSDHLRAAIDAAENDSPLTFRGALDDSGEVAQELSDRIREIGLKCEEVSA